MPLETYYTNYYVYKTDVTTQIHFQRLGQITKTFTIIFMLKLHVARSIPINKFVSMYLFCIVFGMS